jgi:hypothetical protein
LAFLRDPGGILMLVGTLLIAAGLGVAVAFMLVLLIMQLFVNIFTVAFTQELRWYGPGLLDWDPGLRNSVLAATVAGSAILVVGGFRRYGAVPSGSRRRCRGDTPRPPGSPPP